MAENDIMLAGNDAEYTFMDVVAKANNIGVTSENVHTIRNFLILNDEWFGSDAYSDFIDVMSEISDLYLKDYAYARFNKTPDQLTWPERNDMWALESEGGLPISDRQSIHDTFMEMSNDYGILVTQDFSVDESAIFYFSIRE